MSVSLCVDRNGSAARSKMGAQRQLPGEGAYLEGQYGAWMVLGGQGANTSRIYTFDEKAQGRVEVSKSLYRFRVAHRRSDYGLGAEHFDAYSVEDGQMAQTWLQHFTS